MCTVPIIEKPLLLGENRQLFGILSKPDGDNSGSGVLILNAGLLHNVGPFRLHVTLAHELSRRRIPTIRIDQSGKGESPSRSGFTHSESVLADFDDVQREFERIGVHEIAILGLCSGADDATYIAANRKGIKSLVLLDGYARRTRRYYVNHYLPRLVSPVSWIRYGSRLGKKMIQRLLLYSDDAHSDLSIELRDWPSHAEMIERYRSILSGGTRMLSVFTAGQEYYNYRGQLSDALSYSEPPALLDEVYYPSSDHVYSSFDNRQELVDLVTDWLADKLTTQPAFSERLEQTNRTEFGSKVV